MFRPAVNIAFRPFLRGIPPTARNISYTITWMAEGDTGATRSGGSASSDAFSKREAASESMYVKEKELEKLKALKAKINEHKKHLDELDKHVEEHMKGGSKDS